MLAAIITQETQKIAKTDLRTHKRGMLKKTSNADLRAVFGTVTPKTARCILVEKHKPCVVVNHNSEPRSNTCHQFLEYFMLMSLERQTLNRVVDSKI